MLRNYRPQEPFTALWIEDEETGGFNGAKYWTENLGLKTKVLLDPDGGKEINKISV